MQFLNEALIKKVHNLKKENMNKCKKDNDESKGELKMKNEEIKRLHKHK